MIDRIFQCIICNKKNLKHLSKYDAGELVRCKSCGMVFSSIIPSETALSKHYSGYARFSQISQTTIKRYNELLDKFEKFRSNNRILDVGCGEGFFLEQAVHRGWEVHGTECVPQYIEVCENKKIHMHEGILNINNYEPGSFDIITSFEVLEHLNYPVQEVSNFWKLLRKGGLLYVTTPNFNSLSRRILGNKWTVITFPDHLSYFTPATLHKIMSINKFKKIELLSTGISFERLRQSISKNRPSTDNRLTNEKAYQPADLEWQERIESSGLLKIAKRIINFFLTLSGTGDGLKSMYKKP